MRLFRQCCIHLQLAVRDNIIRNNPSDGVMAQIKKLPGRNHGIRHALTLEQQRAFIRYVEENEKFEMTG